MFAGTFPGNWKGGDKRDGERYAGFSFVRTEASTQSQSPECKYPTKVTAQIRRHHRPPSGPKTEAEIPEEMESEAELFAEGPARDAGPHASPLNPSP